MTETITVCESMCRDFYWLWNFDARIVQGLLTVLAASIGAGVAIYIAKIVYPLQKEKDRELEIHQEKRNAYIRYLGALNTFFAVVFRRDEEASKEAFYQTVNEAGEFLFYATVKPAEAAGSYLTTIRDLRSFNSKNSSSIDEDDEVKEELSKIIDRCRAARRTTITAMRIDLMNAGNLETQNIVSAVFAIEKGNEE